MTQKKKILISYDYFTPAFKAGGPITSLVNLVNYTAGDYDLYVLTSAYDLDGSELKVQKNQWITWPNNVKVHYLTSEMCTLKTIRKIIREINPHTIYINGLFSFPFVVYPLWAVRGLKAKPKMVIAPRGMLFPEALQQKKFKKMIYLWGLKKLLLNDTTHWQATGEEEKKSIKRWWSNHKYIHIVENIPNITSSEVPVDRKPIPFPPLKLVTIALVSPMKNHLLVIEALQQINFPVVYDIYGPIKDQKYWQSCQSEIEKLPLTSQVNYRGEINPAMVPETLQQYHVYIQPSQSENFGHSIFEALQQNLPVITSHQTPWNNLEENGAGINTHPIPEKLSNAIIKIKMKYETGYNWESHKVSKNHLQKANYNKQYYTLWSS